MNTRVEPNNQDAEKSVLASMLMSKYALQKCADSLTKDEFYNDNHAKIFEAMKNLNDKGIIVDITTLSAELDRQKVLKQVGVSLRDGSEWNSYSDILKKVGENFQKMSDYEKNAITTAMFGTRQRENGLILLENYNEVMEASKIANESAGTATAKYIKYQDSLEAATNRVTSAFEKMVLGIQGSGTIKDVLSIVATSLEHIKATLLIITGAAMIFNFEKLLKGLTLLSTKFRTFSFMNLGKGFIGKGMLGKISHDTTEDRYKTLENFNSKYVSKLMLS